MRSSAIRFNSDQPHCDLSCMKRTIKIVISAVQTWVYLIFDNRTALLLRDRQILHDPVDECCQLLTSRACRSALSLHTSSSKSPRRINLRSSLNELQTAYKLSPIFLLENDLILASAYTGRLNVAPLIWTRDQNWQATGL
jgi:hypothetical protein